MNYAVESLFNDEERPRLIVGLASPMGANFGEYLDFKQYPFLLMMLLDTDTNGACDKMYAITV